MPITRDEIGRTIVNFDGDIIVYKGHCEVEIDGETHLAGSIAFKDSASPTPGPSLIFKIPREETISSIILALVEIRAAMHAGIPLIDKNHPDTIVKTETGVETGDGRPLTNG